MILAILVLSLSNVPNSLSQKSKTDLWPCETNKQLAKVLLNLSGQ